MIVHGKLYFATWHDHCFVTYIHLKAADKLHSRFNLARLNMSSSLQAMRSELRRLLHQVILLATSTQTRAALRVTVCLTPFPLGVRLRVTNSNARRCSLLQVVQSASRVSAVLAPFSPGVKPRLIMSNARRCSILVSRRLVRQCYSRLHVKSMLHGTHLHFIFDCVGILQFKCLYFALLMVFNHCWNKGAHSYMA